MGPGAEYTHVVFEFGLPGVVDRQTFHERLMSILEEKELDGKKLASVIKRLFQEPELREKMSEQAKKLAKPEAGKIIAQKLSELGARG